MIYFSQPPRPMFNIIFIFDSFSMFLRVEHWIRGWGFVVFLFYTRCKKKSENVILQAEFPLRLFLPHRGPFL